MKEIDRILVPGGVLKASFQPHDFYDEKYKFSTHDEFSKILRSLGYDISIVENEGGRVEVLLAVKPGGTIYYSAKKLMEEDKRDWEEQVKEDKTI